MAQEDEYVKKINEELRAANTPEKKAQREALLDSKRPVTLGLLGDIYDNNIKVGGKKPITHSYIDGKTTLCGKIKAEKLSDPYAYSFDELTRTPECPACARKAAKFNKE